MASSYIG
jgi:hypothetical protein